MKRVAVSVLISVFICMQLAATWNIDVRSGIACTSAGISIGIGENELKVDFSTTYPNLAVHMKNEENWQFKYHTTSGTDLLLDSFFFYNSMNVSMLFSLTGENSAFSVSLGPQLYCSHTDGDRIGLDVTETDIGLNLASVVRARLSNRFGLILQCGIPLAHVSFSGNQKPGFSSIISDERILKEVLYSVSAGFFFEFGGAR